MSNDTEKIMTGDLGKALKPAAMTPLNEGAKSVAMTPAPGQIATNDGVSPVAMTPVAMTPVVSGEDRGLKTVPMTPLQRTPPAPQPVQPQSEKK